MKITRRRKLLIASVACTVLTGGTAFAFWTASGSGSGTASTGTAAAIAVNQGVSITGLYPGGPAKALSGNFDNNAPSASPASVGSVTAVIAPFSSQTDTGKPACTEADYQLSGSATGPYAVPVGAAVGSWSGLTVAMLNTAANQDNCQGLDITINYTANP
jgi:hypothetical protein